MRGRTFWTPRAVAYALGGALAVASVVEFLPRGPVFTIANLAITAGYVFLAAVVVPRVTVYLRRTRIGGIGFFLTCGLHHLDNVFHFLFQPTEQIREVYVESHMLYVDVPQAVFVWMFVTGLYLEFVRWGPWGADTAPREPARRSE